MKIKKIWVALFATVAIAAGWNFNQTQREVEVSDLTLHNLDAIAQGKGIFPSCMKKEGGGIEAEVPFCVNGNCKDTWARKGTLDVNYCSE